MIVNHWHVIYISVPSGHPGVVWVAAYDRKEAIERSGQRAVIGVMEASYSPH